MKLSVIIPAYNEANSIAEALRRVFAVQLPVELEAIVVDDGSTDGTGDAVKRTGLPVRYIRRDSNKGKGSAVRQGIECASGDIILIQDADNEYDPNDYPALIAPIISGQAQVVYGSRILKSSNPHSYKRFYWGGRLLSWWTNLLYGCHITDEPTCYKVFRSDILKSLYLTAEGFEFCPEVTAKVLKKGIAIHEVPITYSPRSIEEGKKIRWTDGVKALWELFVIRFGFYRG